MMKSNKLFWKAIKSLFGYKFTINDLHCESEQELSDKVKVITFVQFAGFILFLATLYLIISYAR